MSKQVSDTARSDAPPRRRLGFLAIPVTMFVILATVFYFALYSGDPSKLPSALIGKPVPETQFPALEGLEGVPGFTSADLGRGEVTVINFWASWCVPCVQEHPLLIALAERTGAKIYGVNYKDQPASARRFLGRYGNPYAAVGTDPNGRGAIEWGVYGMPETFVIDAAGRIAYKHVGPISAESLIQKVIPAIEAARQKPAGAS